LNIHGCQDALYVQFNSRIQRRHMAKLLYVSAEKIAAFCNAKQFILLVFIQERSVRTEKLVRIPFRRVMARSDRNTACRTKFPNHKADGRCRNKPQINDFTTGRLKPGEGEVTQHMARWARIAADYDLSAFG